MGAHINISEGVAAGGEMKRKELKVAIQEGIESEDAGTLEEVVARHRARRAARKK